MNEPKQNTLIPMQDPAGNRCFVNAWDVPSRKADGWTVIGDLAFHTASTRAPVELLAGKGDAAAPAGDPIAAERARARAILKAADDDQAELADKLIADGTPEADAVKALAAARKTKKPPEKPAAAAPASAAAPAPAK